MQNILEAHGVGAACAAKGSASVETGSADATAEERAVGATEMERRVAGAIWVASNNCGHRDTAWISYLPQARAAIRAMREPTDRMREAMWMEPDRHCECWSQRGIDAALEPDPEPLCGNRCQWPKCRDSNLPKPDECTEPSGCITQPVRASDWINSFAELGRLIANATSPSPGSADTSTPSPSQGA